MGVFAIAAFAPLIKTGTGILFFTRAVTGLALGGDYPVSQAVVSETIPAVWRNRSLSVLMLGWYIGAIAGVLIAIPVVQGFLPWEFFFGVEGLVGLLLFLGSDFGCSSQHHGSALRKKSHQKQPEKSTSEFS